MIVFEPAEFLSVRDALVNNVAVIDFDKMRGEELYLNNPDMIELCQCLQKQRGQGTLLSKLQNYIHCSMWSDLTYVFESVPQTYRKYEVCKLWRVELPARILRKRDEYFLQAEIDAVSTQWASDFATVVNLLVKIEGQHITGLVRDALRELHPEVKDYAAFGDTEQKDESRAVVFRYMGANLRLTRNFYQRWAQKHYGHLLRHKKCSCRTTATTSCRSWLRRHGAVAVCSSAKAHAPTTCSLGRRDGAGGATRNCCGRRICVHRHGR
jgi:hypothetical protein